MIKKRKSPIVKPSDFSTKDLHVLAKVKRITLNLDSLYRLLGT